MRKEIKTYETALISLDSAVRGHLNDLYASVYPEDASSSEIKAIIDYYKNIEGARARYGLGVVIDRLTYIKAWARIHDNESIEIKIDFIKNQVININTLLHKIVEYCGETE